MMVILLLVLSVICSIFSVVFAGASGVANHNDDKEPVLKLFFSALAAAIVAIVSAYFAGAL